MATLFPTHIETERLVLEAAGPGAVDPLAFYEICAGDDGIEEATADLTWEPHAHPKETLDFLERAGEQFERGEAAQYVIRPGEGEDGAGEIAGMCGLTIDWDRHCAEPGIWLRRRFWGRRYAGERAVALAALAFDRLDLACLAVEVRDGNEQSRRAVERYVDRLGGRYEGLFRHADAWADGPEDLHRWTVTQAEYDDADPGVAVTFAPADEDRDQRA